MFNDNHIIYEPNYEKYIRTILSEYKDMKDYEKDTINDYMNNIYITFYTTSVPDSLYSTIRYNGKYYLSMNVSEIKNIVERCYESTAFSNELLTNIVPYIPHTFFQDSNLSIPLSKKNINISKPEFYPDNRSDIHIVDDLSKINIFIENMKSDLYKYELRQLIHITVRMNAPRYVIQDILHIVPDAKISCFPIKTNNGFIYETSALNNSLAEYDKKRRIAINKLYSNTDDYRYISDDVYHKVFITCNLSEWGYIMSIYNKYGMNMFSKILFYYDNIKELML